MVNGLWNGELALIQLLGRGDDIFKASLRTPDRAVTREYFMELCMEEPEKMLSTLGAYLGMLEQAATDVLNTRGMSVKIEDVEIDVQVSPVSSLGEYLASARTGAKSGVELGRLLGMIEFLNNGQQTLDAINAEICAESLEKQKFNSAIYALFEELPLEGELADAWKEKCERTEKRRAAVVCRKLFGQIEESGNLYGSCQGVFVLRCGRERSRQRNG